MQTLEQERAKFALEWINRIQLSVKTEDKEKIISYASAMPAMIQINGLGQAAAFYRRKGATGPYYELYSVLSSWLTSPGRPLAITGEEKPDLLSAITKLDMQAYIAASTEAVMFLDWVKKFATAFIERPKKSSSDKAKGEKE